MKLFACLTFAILYLAFASPILAQEEFTFDRAYSDYVYTFDQYRAAHQQYQLKKNEYLKFKTLTAQTDAYAAGLNLLKARDDVIRTHLTTLRLKLAETPGVNPTERQATFSRIDQEVNWLFAHQTRLQNTTNLKELTRISKEIETRYPTITVLMYQSLTTVLASKQNFFRTQASSHYQGLKTKLINIRDSGEDTTIFDRWLLQAQQKLELSLERQSAASSLAAKLGAQTRNLPQEFLAIQTALKDSHQYLKETTSALQEIIRDLIT